MNLKIFINHFNPRYLFDQTRNGYNKSLHDFIYYSISILLWILLIPIKLLELIGFFILFDYLRSTVLSTRALTEFEIKEAKKVFDDRLKYSKIRIRTNSKMAKRGAKYAQKKTLAFVLFRCINFSYTADCENNKTDMSRLIHELVHVYQFEKLGAEYIILALRAQRNGGYDYGGEKILQEKHPLKYFNLEQQAEIIQDYYEALIDKKETEVYRELVNNLRTGEF